MPETDTAHRPYVLADFLGARSRLLHIARRIVGGVPDAEDVVQDTWLRWNGTDRSDIRNAPAFLSLTATRLAITATRTAHVRHRHVGRGPLEYADPGEGPAAAAERAEQLRHAMALLVHRLNPREQAAYVLREAFGYPYRQIGAALGLTEAAARQLVRRARTRVSTGHGRSAPPARRLRLLDAFQEVLHTGDPEALARVARQA